jgi:hypothetical protein
MLYQAIPRRARSLHLVKLWERNHMHDLKVKADLRECCEIWFDCTP